MATMSPAEAALQRRVEGLIRLAAPVLDLLLATGERVSRIAGRGELDSFPIQAPPEAIQLRPSRSAPRSRPAERRE